MEFEKLRHGTELIKRGFARMQKGGVIMDVTNPEQARIAEDAEFDGIINDHIVRLPVLSGRVIIFFLPR